MNSIEHYKELISSLGEFPKEGTFESQTKFNENNDFFYNEIYLKKRREAGYPEIAEKLSSLQQKFPNITDTCSKCVDFFYTHRQDRTFTKQLDIERAFFFEIGFLKYLKSKGFNAERADEEKVGHHKGYPDLQVYDKKGKISCYLEMKYNAAPFVMVKNFVSGRECYEGSLTLNPPKLKRQVAMIGKEIKEPIFYVYWADFPCMKGIFYTDIMNIWSYFLDMGGKKQHDRKVGQGDFRYGRKIGQSDIIYPPIFEMGNFEELIQELTEVTNNF